MDLGSGKSQDFALKFLYSRNGRQRLQGIISFIASIILDKKCEYKMWKASFKCQSAASNKDDRMLPNSFIYTAEFR